MTASRPAPGRLRRALVAALVAATVTLPALAVTAATSVPAAADPPNGGGTGNSDTGGPIGSGAGHHKKGGPGNYSCNADGDWVNDGTKISVVDHPQCVTGPGWEWTDRIFLCPAGFQVFRFYGNRTNPTRGFTVTMLNQSKWCQSPEDQANTQYSFWTTSGYDTHPVLTRANYNDQNKNVEVGVQYAGDNAAGVNRELWRLAGVWTAEMKGARKNPAAGRPFDGNNGCVAAQNPTNPFADFLKSDADPKIKRSVREGLYSMYTSFRDQAGVVAAKKEMGVISVTRDDAGKVHIVWDNSDCASPMRYVATNDTTVHTAAERAKDRFTGVCYIPLERQADEYRAADGDLGLSFMDLRRGYGLRYSTFYKGKANTADHPMGRDNIAPAGLADRAILKAWRARMKQWYAANTTTNTDSLRENGHQVIPANPYVLADTQARTPTGKQQGYSRALAMDTLTKYAKCRFGSRFQLSKSKPKVVNVDASAGLKMLNREVLHAGGYPAADADAQTITIAPLTLKCLGGSAKCAAAHPVLKELGYRVHVALPASYRMCQDVTGETCDYQVSDVKLGARTLPCRADGSGGCTIAVLQRTSSPANLDITLVFFTPTQDDDKLAVTVSNTHAKYVYLSTTTRLDFDVIDPATGKPYPGGKVVTTTSRVHEAESVRVTSDPVPLVQNGGAYTYYAPVSGAIATGN